MKVTVRKCDFCEKEIATDSKSRTIMILKSHKDCVDLLPDKNFDICTSCLSKALTFLYKPMKVE